MSDEISRMTKLRDDIEAVKLDLAQMCNPSRELSIAITKLDEARLWGQEAIAIRAVALSPNATLPYSNGASDA